MAKKREYRVISSNEIYLIQQSDNGDDWYTVGTFDNLDSAKKMVTELRNGTL